MEPVKGIVAQLMEQMSSKKGTNTRELQAAWEKIAGDKNSRVVDFKEGVLTVGADTSMRLVKLNLNREALLKALQKDFPSIIKINFKAG